MWEILGLAGLAIFAGWWLYLQMEWFGSPPTVCNESHVYQAMREGKDVCRPFKLRVLARVLPFPRGIELGALVAAPVLVAVVLLQRGVGLTAALCGGVLWIGLPGVWGFNARHKGLLDALVLGLGLLAVMVPWDSGGQLLALLAAMGKEVSPVWMGLWSGDWRYLYALTVPLIALLVEKTGSHPLGKRHEEVRQRPFWAARRCKSTGQYLSWKAITPFGVVLLGLHDPMALAAFVIGFLFTFLATDMQRIWQPFCALPLIAATVALVPAPLLPALAVLQLVNPWAGEGA